MDPLLCLVLLIFTSLPGNNCVRTLEKITVQRGGSVIIPCLYEQKYKDHVKYWCKGSMYTFCRTMVRSDSPQSKGDVSIADDPDQLVFTVTMRNLQEKDSDTYWCVVEIGGTGTIDDRTSLELKVITGVQSVWAESSFTAERGGSVTIPCHYDQKYKHHVKYWCKGYHWSTCTIMVRSDSRQSKGDVSINDDPDQLVFTVTMRNLQDKDSGTYWCAVEINGGSDDAVILPLIVRTVATVSFQPTTESVTSSDQQRTEWTGTAYYERRLIDTASPTHVLTLNITNEKNKPQSSSTLLVSLVTLGVLLILLTVVMVTCILQNRQKERETRKRGIDVSFTATLPTDHEEEVSYSTVVHKKLMEEKKINKSSTHRADELIYSSVIKKKQSSEDPDGGKNEDGNWCSYYIG
ncbi:polymeric immunoglobulin receptor-like [Scleropages formosus]|uniref:polymeric immunoglobulin receptor-like n=1 Tax=Scleropages formosus TaxID=113540 RepID=UPI0010FA68EB|nr:polymeric immunoglobulin receptor-like [Scleropages formosus]